MMHPKTHLWHWLLLVGAMLFLALATRPSVAWAASSHAARTNLQADMSGRVGQKSILRPLPQPKNNALSVNRCGAVYRVKPGDTLRSIARKCGVSIWRLRLLNGLKRTRLHPGQILRLKKSRTPRVIKPTPTPPVPTLKQALPTPVYYPKKTKTK